MCQVGCYKIHQKQGKKTVKRASKPRRNPFSRVFSTGHQLRSVTNPTDLLDVLQKLRLILALFGRQPQKSVLTPRGGSTDFCGKFVFGLDDFQMLRYLFQMHLKNVKKRRVNALMIFRCCVLFWCSTAEKRTHPPGGKYGFLR